MTLQLTELDLSAQQARGQSFPAVDLAKMLCAILVVAIHLPPLSELYPELNYYLTQALARVAVPFFFVGGGTSAFKKVMKMLWILQKYGVMPLECSSFMYFGWPSIRDRCCCGAG